MRSYKLAKLGLTWREGGIFGLAKAVVKSVQWRLWGRKNLLLFEFDFDQPLSPFPQVEGMVVRELQPADLDQIKSDFFSLMKGDLENDKQCFLMFESHRDSNRRCYLVERRGRVVHYSWVTTHVSRYGDVEVGSEGAYIGPCFTLPEARGRGIYSHALKCIINTLRQEGIRRVFIQSRKDNLASIRGIEAAGFFRVQRIV